MGDDNDANHTDCAVSLPNQPRTIAASPGENS